MNSTVRKAPIFDPLDIRYSPSNIDEDPTPSPQSGMDVDRDYELPTRSPIQANRSDLQQRDLGSIADLEDEEGDNLGASSARPIAGPTSPEHDAGNVEQDPPIAAGTGSDQLPFVSAIEDIRIAREFIKALSEASLDSPLSKASLSSEVLNLIKNPKTKPLIIDNPSDRLSLDLFLAIDTASQDTYETVRSAITRRFPEEDSILSYYNQASCGGGHWNFINP
ncbi:hypothetical protein B0H34DRAFT_825102 [Crassisporium funariophilum]|nr:hypothetical protein B0H34DRAFT_825102 [Crassisporium funariophilum]